MLFHCGFNLHFSNEADIFSHIYWPFGFLFNELLVQVFAYFSIKLFLIYFNLVEFITPFLPVNALHNLAQTGDCSSFGLPWWLNGKESTCRCRKHWVQSLGREDPLEKEMATYSSILAQEILWTEETGRLQSMGWPKSRR